MTNHLRLIIGTSGITKMEGMYFGGPSKADASKGSKKRTVEFTGTSGRLRQLGSMCFGNQKMNPVASNNQKNTSLALKYMPAKESSSKAIVVIFAIDIELQPRFLTS